jgi:holo-[acyl-carrier protein] synthase
MPVRFPLAIGIGTDICHIPRIARIITRRDEGGIEKFAGKIFNDFERPIFTTRLQRYRAARDAARSAPGASKRMPSDGELAALNAFARWVAGR